jgi:two-component system nitrate/nitrite response regulator NarL
VANGASIGPPTTQVAVIEKHALLAEALTCALSGQGYATTGVRLPADNTEPDGLLQHIVTLQPQVVVLGPDLGDAGDGMGLVQALNRAGCCVIVVTPDREDERWGHALAMGAHAVLSASEGLHTVTEAIRLAAAGIPAMNELQRLDLIQRWRRMRPHTDGNHARLKLLSRREREVLSRLAAGNRVSDIAQHLCVSEATIRTHVKSILAKLNVNSQIAAVAIARDVGWRLPG